jgi:hypothetical protein
MNLVGGDKVRRSGVRGLLLVLVTGMIEPRGGAGLDTIVCTMHTYTSTYTLVAPTEESQGSIYLLILGTNVACNQSGFKG